MLFSFTMKTQFGFIILLALSLGFTGNLSAQEDDLGLFRQKIAQNISELLRSKVEEDGPNCFNTALVALGAVSRIELTDGYEVEDFLAGATQDAANPNAFVCRGVDIQNGEKPEYGDLGILAERFFKKESVLAHAFIVIDESKVFEKKDQLASSKPEFKRFKDAVSSYDIARSTPERQASHDLSARSIGCRRGAVAEYLEATQNPYDDVPPVCEIFRCRPRNQASR